MLVLGTLAIGYNEKLELMEYWNKIIDDKNNGTSKKHQLDMLV